MRYRCQRIGFVAMVLSAAVFAMPTFAQTTFNFTAGSITTDDQDPGFKTDSDVIAAFPVNGVVSFGSPLTFDFAEVWAVSESSVQFEPGDDDDIIPETATATLTLTLPIATTLNFTGQTVGERTQTFDAGNGLISWNGPEVINAMGKQFNVTLSDTVYNDLLAIFGDGRGRAGTVTATVTEIPEPGSMLAWLVALGVAAQRRGLAWPASVGPA